MPEYSTGYRCVHRSPDAANYLRGEDGFDVLYAQTRPTDRRVFEITGY